MDGYTVAVYNGLFRLILIVEGKIQDSKVLNRFLYGILPNKKGICASISLWDGSAKIEYENNNPSAPH